MDFSDVNSDIESVVLDKDQIAEGIARLAREIEKIMPGTPFADWGAQGRGHGDGGSRSGASDSCGNGLDGRLELRCLNQIQRCGADCERSRHFPSRVATSSLWKTLSIRV